MTTQEEVIATWDAEADTWDTQEGTGEYSEWVHPKFWQASGLDRSNAKAMKVLDFGCGTGLLTEKLQKECGHVVSVDASPKMVAGVEKKVRCCWPWDNL